MNKKTDDIFPVFAKDRDRIRYNSQKYANVTLTEAFADAYGLSIPKIDIAENTPNELRVGDLLSVKILNISKNHVEFDSTNVKANLTTSANLFKYDRFKHFTPKDDIKVRVTSVIKDRVIVDPFGPMLEEFVVPRVNNPWIQKKLDGEKLQPIKVKNLRLSRGGFLGDAVIPTISDWVGEDYTVEAFIPGSQIVLNIADNFEDFVGKDVDTFIVNYIPKPGVDNKMSLICSSKEYIKFLGEATLVYAFKAWCDNNEYWKQMESTVFKGKVTGVIKSSKKCGVFVEIPSMNITGMVATKPDELVNYKIKQEVDVQLVGFDEETYFNQEAQQQQHIEPYVITDGCLETCNIKPILKFA